MHETACFGLRPDTCASEHVLKNGERTDYTVLSFVTLSSVSWTVEAKAEVGRNFEVHISILNHGV